MGDSRDLASKKNQDGTLSGLVTPVVIVVIIFPLPIFNAFVFVPFSCFSFSIS